MNQKRLDEAEVRNRLVLAKGNPAVVDELYNFGLLLLKEAAEDIRRLDTKAAAMAGYSGAVVTVLISSVSLWRGLLSPFATLFVFIAGLVAIVAVVMGVRVMALRRFDWFSADEWLEAGCLSDIEKLKRYRVLATWQAWNSHKDAHSQKALLLRRTQWALVSTGILLLIAFIMAVWGNLPVFLLPRPVAMNVLPDSIHRLWVEGWQIVSRIVVRGI